MSSGSRIRLSSGFGEMASTTSNGASSGMDSEDSLMSSRKKRERRVWTDEEEDTLINILEELVANGNARKNGTFKPGTSTMIENALLEKFPNSGLKYSPHVESKIKDFKKKYAVVYDMLQKSGFGWNDMRKCVEVDNDEAWYAYVKHHSDADGWRGRPFPRYETFAQIFGVDRAIGKAAKVPAEIVEEVNEEFGNQEQNPALQTDQLSGKSDSTTKSESTSSMKKRKRENDDNISRGLDKFAATFKEVMETSNEHIRLLVERLQPLGSKKDEVRAKKDELWAELLKLDLSTKDRIKALKILMADSAELFLALDREEEKMEFILQIIC